MGNEAVCGLMHAASQVSTVQFPAAALGHIIDFEMEDPTTAVISH